MRKKRIDWHSGFVSAMKLELIDNEDDLEFHEETVLETKKQRIDLLIIKADHTVRIKNEIGTLFRYLNIFEYKNPNASLNIGTFYKTLGYVCRYLYERNDHSKYPATAYSMILVRESLSDGMTDDLAIDGISVVEYLQGIYEIKGCIPFKAWLIVTGELSEEHIWLKALTRSGSRQNIDDLIEYTRGKEDLHKEYADCVMNVFARANNELMKKVKEEEGDMCEAIEELFADKIDYLLNRVDEVQDMLDDAERKLQKTEAKVSEAEAKVSKAEAKVSEAEAKVSKAEAKVSKAEAKVSKAEAIAEREKARADAAEAKLRAAGLA